MQLKTVRCFLLLFLAVILTGCALPGTLTSPTVAPSPLAQTTGLAVQVTPTPVPDTPVPSSTLTHEPTTTPTQTSTSTPTPHPLSILALRQRSYQGSSITIEQQLDPGSNYYRYIASYQSDGLKIYALLTIPFGERPASGWPAIVFNHGYIPPEQYRTTERYIAYVDRLASSGYIVFRIDYRGHDRSEGEAAGAYGDPGYTIDVLNAVGSLRQFPDADPESIGMWGHSMGGFLTLRAMVISKDIKAGVIWGGVVGSYPDMLYNWRRSDAFTPTPNPTPSRRWRTFFLDEFGSPEENPEFWASISANSFLEDLSGPVQLHHSVDDKSVPVEFSEILADQITQAGGVVELYTYENDDHNISQSFSLAMRRTIEFFDTYLKTP